MKIQNGFFRHFVNRVFGEATLLALVVLLPITAVHAQHEADNWIFGNQAGLTFLSTGPVPFNGGGTPVMTTQEGSSSISDQSGHLLFYTDGRFVWNKNHIQMTNGFGLNGASSATQSALIVPWPGTNCQKYFVFTVDDMSPQKQQQLNYSVVDMSAAGSGGLGDVTIKNTLLKKGVSEKLTAAKDHSGTGFWVVAHGFSQSNTSVNNEFYVYHIDASTTATNIASSLQTWGVGSPHQNGAGSEHPSSGQMKISPDERLIACAVGGAFVEILNFNSTTGKVFGPPTTFNSSNSPLNDSSPYKITPYGLEFSPNSQILYVSTIWGTSRLFQLVISPPAWTQLATGASGGYDIGQLQLGPDGKKVYVARSGKTQISAINSPDTPGLGCSFDNPPGPMVSSGGVCQLGLPTMIGGSFSCAATACATITEPNATCDHGVFTYTFTVTNNTNQQIEWLLFSTPAGATYGISPPYIPLGTPLPPGGHTTASVTITNASPGDHICLNVALADKDVVSCCTIQTCFDLCPCLKITDAKAVCARGPNGYTFTATIQNLTGVAVQQLFVVPISPANINVTLSPTTMPIPFPGGTTVTGTITGAGAQPGAQVCLRFVPFGTEAQCCSTKLCFVDPLPPCRPPPPPDQPQTKKPKK